VKLVFYIVIKGQKNKRFDKAYELDDYVKSKKFPKAAKIIIMNDMDNVGEFTIEKYLQLDKELGHDN